MITFRGLQPTPLVDYPDEVACTFFLGGCNFRCPFCYNQDLVLEPEGGPVISEVEALDFLKQRAHFLDGVCLTGGEPLLHYPALLGFLHQAKALGYKIKLDTNGSFPDAVKGLIEAGLVDYFAMDIKATPDKYERLAGGKVDLAKIKESVRLIKNSGIPYEFRTTVSTLLTAADLEAISQWLGGKERYYLQQLKSDVPLLDPDFPKEHLDLAPLKGKFKLRGV